MYKVTFRRNLAATLTDGTHDPITCNLLRVFEETASFEQPYRAFDIRLHLKTDVSNFH